MQESACLIPIYLLEKHLVAFGHSDIISSCDYSQYDIGSDKVSLFCHFLIRVYIELTECIKSERNYMFFFFF